MNFDLRMPIGILFTLFGAILTGYGLMTKGSKIYEKSLGMNINISWGIVLLIFGLTMYIFAKRGQSPE